MVQYGAKQGVGTKAWGIAVVIALHAAAGYVLITGLGTRVVSAVLEPIQAEVIEEAPPPEDIPPPPPPPDLDVPPPPRIELPEIDFAGPPSETAIQQVEVGPPVVNEPPPPPPPPAPAGPTTNPTRIERRNAIPPYPEASIRLEEEGETTIAVCVNAEGNVQSAEVAGSSGSDRLDRAAVTWIRRQPFNPGLTNGVPETKCTQTIVVWELPEL